MKDLSVGAMLGLRPEGGEGANSQSLWEKSTAAMGTANEKARGGNKLGFLYKWHKGQFGLLLA